MKFGSLARSGSVQRETEVYFFIQKKRSSLRSLGGRIPQSRLQERGDNLFLAHYGE